jgi:hypothetical protein
MLKVAAAFATESGAEELRRNIIRAAAFDAIDKEWLIGVQDGVTQPEALRRLRAVRRSDVRIPFGAEALRSPSLRASTFFHPKMYYFENSATGRVCLISASANLTYRGLRNSVEQFLGWDGTTADAEATSFNDW